MIKPIKLTHLRSKIISLEYLNEEHLFAVTDDHQVHILSTTEQNSNKSFHFSSLGKDAKQVTITKDAHYLAYSQKSHIYLIDLDIQEAIHRVSIDSGEVEVLCFDVHSEYLIVGTSKGRVLLWQRDNNEMLSRLCSFPEHVQNMIVPLQNYVSSLASYHHLIASSGYGDSIVINNLSTGVNPIRIYPGRSRLNVLVFIDENTLLTGNEEGRVAKIFIHENRPHHQVSASIGAIKHLLVLSDKTFALAASTHKDIALINIETMQVIESHYISLPYAITSMSLGNDMSVYIALETGAIYSVKLMPITRLKMRIENRQYELAYQLIEQVPILKESSWFADLEKIFSQHYARALHSLLLHDEPAAHRHLEEFVRTPSKKKVIQELFYAFHNYERLQFLLKNSRLNAAYGLVEKHRPLRMTPEFHEIEKKWESFFDQAQKLILQDRETEAKKLLQSFNTVSEKAPLIRLLLEVSNDITIFSKAIATKDYKTLHAMTKRYPALKTLPSHQHAIEETDVLIEQIMIALKEDRFEDARASCELLLDVPHLIKHYSHISTFIDKAEHLQKAEEAHELRLCYETLDSFVELAILPRSKILESRWHQMTKRCENSALTGDVSDILKRIKSVMPLSSRQERLGTLLRLAYNVQLKELPEGDPRFLQGAEQYMKFFGSDSEMRELLKKRQISFDAPLLDRDCWLKFYTHLPEVIYEM